METLLMSAQERKRLEVFGRVKEGTMKLVEASELLKLSYRQPSGPGAAIRKQAIAVWCIGLVAGRRTASAWRHVQA